MKESSRRISDFTVLCVVDDFDLTQELDTRFKSRYHYTSERGEFYRIFTATRGQEALDLSFKDGPIFAVLDEDLSDMTGYELARQLEDKVGKRHGIFYVFLVGEEEPARQVPDSLNLGVYYITKPVTAETIDQNIQAIAGHRGVHSPQGKNLCSHLPTSPYIEKEFDLLPGRRDWALLHICTNWDKELKDVYGFGVPDKIVCFVADFIEETIDQHGAYDDFIGHIGGDRFIVITQLDKLESIIRSLETCSFEDAPEFRPSQISQGSPALLSIVTLQATDGPFSDRHEIIDWVMDAKKV